MRTWTWVSYVAAVALGVMGATTYTMAMAPVITPPPAFEGPFPMNCGTVVEWGSGLGTGAAGDRTAAQASAVEEACQAAVREDWIFFLALLTVTIVLLIFFVLAVLKANARTRRETPTGLASRS